MSTAPPNSAPRPRNGLAALSSFDAADDAAWSDADLRALLRHQLATPIQVDLRGLCALERERTVAVLDTGGVLLKSFGNLFAHPHPPVAMLRLIKDYAKVAGTGPHARLPGAVATVLYFLAISAALVKCQTRITRLSDEALRKGLEWCLSQPWVDDESRKLWQEAGRIVAAGRGGRA